MSIPPFINFSTNRRKFCPNSSSPIHFEFLRFFLPCLLILVCPLNGQQQQQFLTPADFRKALDEERVTYLTEMDFHNARKYKDLLEGKSRSKSSILTQQRFYRGDIRGKAAWKRERHKKMQELGRRSNGSSSSRRYNGVANVVKKWPNGRIPYVLAMDYSERERAVLARAFQEYQSRTCIRFVPKTPFDHDFLYIGKIDGCYSDVGRAGGKQELSLDDGCLHVDTVIHELMHSVGFYHEHERWDRDKYLVILWQNIDRDAYDQFGRVDLVESNYYGQNYDYHSIMHYDSLAFSRNGRETLLAREPTMTSVMGSAMDFSSVDLAKIHHMYQCMEVDQLSPPQPLPPSSSLLQSLEFTGDNSILGLLPSGLPSPPPPPPPAFRFPLSRPPSAALSAAASAGISAGSALPRPLPQQQQRHLMPTQLIAEMGAVNRPSKAGISAAAIPQLLPLYLRVNSQSSAGGLRRTEEVADLKQQQQQQQLLPEASIGQGMGGGAFALNNGGELIATAAAEEISNGGSLSMGNLANKAQLTAVCADRLPMCPFWLAFCRSNGFHGQLMRQFCARSCQFCNANIPNANNANNDAEEEGNANKNWSRTFPVLVNAQQQQQQKR